VTPGVVVVIVVIAVLRLHRIGRHAAAGWTDKPVMGASCTGSYEVTPPGHSRAAAAPARPTNRTEDNKIASG